MPACGRRLSARAWTGGKGGGCVTARTYAMHASRQVHAGVSCGCMSRSSCGTRMLWSAAVREGITALHPGGTADPAPVVMWPQRAEQTLRSVCSRHRPSRRCALGALWSDGSSGLRVASGRVHSDVSRDMHACPCRSARGQVGLPGHRQLIDIAVSCAPDCLCMQALMVSSAFGRTNERLTSDCMTDDWMSASSRGCRRLDADMHAYLACDHGHAPGTTELCHLRIWSGVQSANTSQTVCMQSHAVELRSQRAVS